MESDSSNNNSSKVSCASLQLSSDKHHLPPIRKKKTNRIRKITVWTPESDTDWESKNLMHWISKETRIFDSTIVKDVFGGHHIRYYKGIFFKYLDELSLLWKSVSELKCHDAEDVRGAHKVLYIGHWTPKGGPLYNTIFETQDSKDEQGKKVIEMFAPWSIRISDILRQDYPAMAAMMETLPKEFRKFDLFSLLILNQTTGQNIHVDKFDWRNGYCAVFPFGNYKGGALSFPQLQMEILLNPGDLILFKSWLFHHGNLEVYGDRSSAVFVQRNTTMNYFAKYSNRAFGSDEMEVDSISDKI